MASQNPWPSGRLRSFWILGFSLGVLAPSRAAHTSRTNSDPEKGLSSIDFVGIVMGYGIWPQLNDSFGPSGIGHAWSMAGKLGLTYQQVRHAACPGSLLPFGGAGTATMSSREGRAPIESRTVPSNNDQPRVFQGFLEPYELPGVRR